ncbi:unnamed protein product [Protopolystoma xenopodis]|uniref:Uncharacterized protein n=1 Tax=Protopolystoma xenopodis TaxID=117903 RepID=A0A448XE06_9PLAT|nr:unnamed protein product [Protopolystoma xenopodis]
MSLCQRKKQTYSSCENKASSTKELDTLSSETDSKLIYLEWKHNSMICKTLVDEKRTQLQAEESVKSRDVYPTLYRYDIPLVTEYSGVQSKQLIKFSGTYEKTVPVFEARNRLVSVQLDEPDPQSYFRRVNIDWLLDMSASLCPATEKRHCKLSALNSPNICTLSNSQFSWSLSRNRMIHSLTHFLLPYFLLRRFCVLSSSRTLETCVSMGTRRLRPIHIFSWISEEGNAVAVRESYAGEDVQMKLRIFVISLTDYEHNHREINGLKHAGK